MRTSSQSTIFSLDKLRRLELRSLESDDLLHFFGSARISNITRAIFTLPFEIWSGTQSALEEILGTIQFLSAGSGPVELSVFDGAVTCATRDGRSVEVHPRPRMFVEECANIFLDLLKPSTSRMAVELEDQGRFQWLKQVFEQNDVTDLRVRLGREALQMSRAVVDYLALFDESEEQTEGEMGSGLEFPLPLMQTLAFEDGMVDIPQLLRMVTSRVNGRGAASARIQEITLINCYTRQSSDLSPRFRDLGIDLTLQ